ncbi:MAG: acyl-CoA dehydratase activase [bacterium]|nr:acyl-CoA dehydratase activase [bacterium]
MYLGIDVGSVSVDLALLDKDFKLLAHSYLRTKGRPIDVIKQGLEDLADKLGMNIEIEACGATGSGRMLAGVLVGADCVVNEITAHAVAAIHINPDVKTVLEIGGQDSKIIIIRDGIPVDFAMNTVCAAGTGSFLDHQAERLKIPIEEFGALALKADLNVKIAGRCTVFAESDMIHKQQLGYSNENIIGGLCRALVRNYLNNLVKGKEILAPIIFQGGVAANQGIKKVFEEELNLPVFVPKEHKIMGAIGAALLAKERKKTGQRSKFKGFYLNKREFETSCFECQDCVNHCEVIVMKEMGELIASWGSRCGKRSHVEDKKQVSNKEMKA